MLSGIKSFFLQPQATHWMLLVASDGHDASDFFEIRRNSKAVWVAGGKPFTTGEQVLKAFTTEGEASDYADGLAAAKQAQGYQIVHQGSYLPGQFDFDVLEDVIAAGARQAFDRICTDHPDQAINGFALYSDGGGMTICSAAMSTSSFDNDDVDADYYRTSFVEWPLSTDAGLLLAYRMILMPSYNWDKIPFEREIPDYVDRFFECCVRALEKLDRDGSFGAGEARANFLLLFGDSDGGPIKSHVKRLNPAAVFERYSDQFDDG